MELKPGDVIKVRRPRLLEKRAREMRVKEVRADGTIVALASHRQARGRGWVTTTTFVRPNEVIEKVGGQI